MFKSIRNRLIGIIALFILCFASAILTTMLTLKKQESQGTIINLAGKQRMLLQKMTKEALLSISNESTNAKATANLFDKTLNGLIYGDEELRLPATEDGEIKASLESLNKKWEKFQASLNNILEKKDFEASLKYVKENNILLLGEMNSVVSMYEAQAKKGIVNLNYLLLLFLFLTIVLGGVTIYLSKKFLIKPINSLIKAADKIAEGQVDFQLKVKNDDEIGKLRKNFNKMINNIAAANTALIEEKNSVEQKVFEATEKIENQRIYLHRNVEELLKAMQNFENGDLTIQLQIENNDEIGKLKSGFNNSVANIRKMIEKIADVTDSVISASLDISNNSELMSNGNNDQLQQTNDFSRSIEEIAETVNSTTRNISSVASVANESGENAKESVQIVQQTLDGMKKISEIVLNASHTVSELGTKSNKIGEIVQVIEDIADQTNLLALNAAIEAARAGDQGRGFAVVADEVRKLAERTSTATKEIIEMISQIQNSTNAAVTSINEGTVQVNQSQAMGEKAGESLKLIMNSSTNVTDSISQVATASEEQSSTIEVIRRNVDSFVKISQNSADSVQKVAGSAEYLNQLVLDLQSSISFFNFDNESELQFGKNKKNAINSQDVDIAISAHKLWKVKINKILKGEEIVNSNQVLSHKECQLGKLYYTSWKEYFHSNSIYKELGQRHEDMHNALKLVVKMFNENNKKEAMRKADEVYMIADEVIRLLEMLKNEISAMDSTNNKFSNRFIPA